MKELVLVGATHGASIPSFAGVQHCETEPPYDFVEVTGLNQSDKVALELFPGACEAYSPPTDLDTQERIDDWIRLQNLNGTHFFRTLATRLLQDGISVVEIDDERLVHQVQPRLVDTLGRLSSAEYRQEGFLSTQQMQRRGTIITLNEFINSTLREDILFNNLVDSDADIAVIGQKHADRLAADKVLQARLGLKVTDYLYADIPHPEFMNPWDGPFETKLWRPQPDIVQESADDANITRELDRRRYNAFSIGRILGRKEQEPDYLGRFYISGVAAGSLFELHVTERSNQDFAGLVYDGLGDAEVEGTIDSEGIIFTKKYDLATVEPKMRERLMPIYYQGEFEARHNQYKGRYGANSEDARFGNVFMMRPYQPRAITYLDDYSYIYAER